MKHTPGPWHIESLRSPFDGAVSAGIWAGGEPMAGAHWLAEMVKPINMADARLIAAAPAMLDTLRQTLHYLYEDGATGYIVDDIEEVIRAAGAEL